MKVIFTYDNSFQSWIIRLLTNSKYSHCGIVDCMTNTIIDSELKNNGVSEYPFRNIIIENIGYEEIDIPCAPNSIVELVRTQVGKPYDILAIIGYPFNRNWEDDNKWFCSELIAWSFKEVGCPLIHKKSYRVTPGQLYNSLKKFNIDC
ncbi:MAG: hypothetical protein PHC28_09310 [Flavobacterium sp.]|uniref:hypothetical protein n=1 Tax=Flavobacterium sp. TaxID=239 RepID=UPI002624A187|nr:hypothetical protein [Flavobacterium sp.]MDD5150667.1 hypothetical protein [Flavobacterium sp.]